MTGEKNIIMISFVGVLAVILIVTIISVFVLGHQTSEFQEEMSSAVLLREELQGQLNDIEGDLPDVEQREAAAKLSELQKQYRSLQEEVEQRRQARIEAESKVTDAQHQLTEMRGY